MLMVMDRITFPFQVYSFAPKIAALART
jgi:hypothetical protein